MKSDRERQSPERIFTKKEAGVLVVDTGCKGIAADALFSHGTGPFAVEGRRGPTFSP